MVEQHLDMVEVVGSSPIPRTYIKPFILNNEGERFFVFQGFTPTSHNKAQWGCCSCVALGVAVLPTGGVAVLRPFSNIFSAGIGYHSAVLKFVRSFPKNYLKLNFMKRVQKNDNGFCHEAEQVNNEAFSTPTNGKEGI